MESPNTATLSDEEIIEHAMAYSFSNYEEPAFQADEITWIDVAGDESRWDESEHAARQHRKAREAGLQRYAVVWLRTRDRLYPEVEHRRSFHFDQCGNALLLP